MRIANYPHARSLLALPEQLELANLQPGIGLQTDFSESQQLDFILRIREGQVPQKISWEDYLVDRAKWQYPEESSFVKEAAGTWRKIRAKHGQQLVWTQKLSVLLAGHTPI